MNILVFADHRSHTLTMHLANALYHGNTAMRRLIVGFFLLEVFGMIIGLALALPGITFDELCLVLGVPHSLIIYAYEVSWNLWVHRADSSIPSSGASIIFQTFLFSITVYKFYHAARSGLGDVPLIVLLVRDGTWAFIILFGKDLFRLLRVPDQESYPLFSR